MSQDYDPDDGLHAPEGLGEVSTPPQGVAGSTEPHLLMAITQLEDAYEALENAEGALRVAEARATEEEADPTLAGWQKLASAEAARVADRRCRRCDEAVLRADAALVATEAAVAELQSAQMGAGDDSKEKELHYANVFVFVETFLVRIYARHYRPVGEWRWCALWWEHPEAIARLEALWQAFEVLRDDPGTGPATWWQVYVDPTMAALADDQGPFAQCKSGREAYHHAPEPLPIVLAPPALSAPES